MNLADRGGRHGFGVDVGQHATDGLAPFGGHQLLQAGEGHARGVVAQLGEPGLDPLGVLGFKAGQVDRRQHLAELHGGALHLPELHHDLLDHRRRPLALRPLARLFSAGAIEHTTTGDTRALAGHEAAEARGAPGSGGGGAVGHTRPGEGTVGMSA
jgi:hypothetical protein